MDNLFAKLHARVQRKAARPPQPDAVQPTWLADQCLRSGEVTLIRRHITPLIHTREILAITALDEVIFDHAVREGMRIVTADHGFANFLRHDHRRGHGALILPPSHGHQHWRQFKTSLRHFDEHCAQRMREAPDLVALYKASGSFRLYVPAPGTPKNRKRLIKGRYFGLS
jgi:hypothetical protein